jgi:CubicO group peptidase (beta-lactamase class C family)
MNNRFTWLMLVLILLRSQVAAADPTPDALTTRVDEVFAEWNNTNAPGCGVAVSRNGTLIYQRGFGIANLELGVPIMPASIFPAASISKQFTALSILLLAERGQLSLDDPVWKYIPDWASREHRITIRHLLTHTSGLREAFTLIGVGSPREDGLNVNDAIARVLARQRGLNFVPGTEFQYNNGAYNLLGTIVKKVSGKSLREFAHDSIFKLLGMTHTHFHDDPAMLVPHRVTGYSRGKDGFRLARPEGGIVGNAGLFTTAADLMKWEQNFADARVGTPALLAAMQNPVVATEWGDGSFYGFGLLIGEHRGLRTIGHGGGDPGISTYILRYPDQGLAVTVLGNMDEIPTMKLTRSVADIFVADAFPAAAATNPPASGASVSLTPEYLAELAGLYRDPTTETLGRFFVRDGKLMASPDAGDETGAELVPMATNRFVLPGTQVAVEFVPASNGRAQEARVTGVGAKPRVSQKLTPITVSNRELRVLAGEYVSTEIETTCVMVVQDSQLVAKITGRADSILSPVFKDSFSGLGIVKFTRNQRGTVTGFTFNRADVRGLRFDRVKK